VIPHLPWKFLKFSFNSFLFTLWVSLIPLFIHWLIQKCIGYHWTLDNNSAYWILVYYNFQYIILQYIITFSIL
jgi:hypothetical protein